MGNGCSEHNLPATLTADNQARGRDLFTEAERYKQMDGEQTAHYERFMAGHYGIKTGKSGKSGWDILAKSDKASEKPLIMDDRLYAHPSTVFSKKFYGSIDDRLTSWSKGKDTSRASYDKNVGKPVGKVLDAVNDIVKTSSSISQMDNKLKAFGLTADTVYDGRDYLRWLQDGGHLRSQGEAQPLIQAGNHIAKAQANLNLTWTLGNGVDMIRVMSHYASRPNGYANTLKGLYEGASKNGWNPFRRIPSLDKAGVYGSQYADRGGSNSLNPFEWSVTAQKNMTYYLDKAAGGDGHTGIRDTLFDSKPWDRPRYDRFEGSGLVAGLGRYGINETRWLFKTSKAALLGDGQAWHNLTLNLVGRAAFTGVVSTVPAPLWNAMPSELKKNIQKFEEKYNLNLIKIGSRAAFKAMGVKAEINLDKYLQPQVPILGARAESLANTGNTIVNSGLKTVTNAAQLKVLPAGAHAIATALALANFGAYSNLAVKAGSWMAKAADLGTKLENSHLNSTTLTKMFSTLAEELEGEFKLDRVALKEGKAIFGAGNVKKAK